MAYRFEPGEPLGDELRRALVEQLRRASDDLARPTPDPEGDPDANPARATGPDDESVHTARKRIKKARSLLRLGRADLGKATVSHAQAELRAAADRLAPQREADAAVESARWLLDVARRSEADGHVQADEPAVLVAAAAALVAATERDVDQRRAAGAALTWGGARTVARTLEQTADWLAGRPSRADGWDAIGPGLRRQYERGREAQRGLPAEPSVEELHEWRKRVKDLGYHERVLRRAWPSVQRPLLDAANELADLLGLDHDLGLLLARIDPSDQADQADDPVSHLSADDRRALRALVVGERARLEGEARRIGRRLYAERPGAWTRRHRAWWSAAAAEVEAVAAAETETEREPARPDPG